jgi:hypothetical protein
MHVYYLLQPPPTSNHTFDTAVSSANPSTRWASPPPDRREEFFAAAGPASHSYASTPWPTAQTMRPQPPLPALSHHYASATQAPDDGVQDTRLRQVARRRHVDNLGNIPARRKPSAFPFKATAHLIRNQYHRLPALYASQASWELKGAVRKE